MKKILYCLTLVLAFTLFTGNVSASEPYSCYYRSDKVDFILYEEAPGLKKSPIVASPTKKFTINKETQDSLSSWSGDSLQVYGEDRTLEKTDGCYNYMYYDQVNDGLFKGANKIYFSNEEVSIEGVDLILRKAEYDATPDNAILEDILCSYGPDVSDLVTYGLADLPTISFKISPNKENGVGTYEIFKNLDTSLYKGDYIINPKENTINYSNAAGTMWYELHDKFHIRVFWNETTKAWSCPSTIFVGLAEKIGLWVDSGERHLAYSDQQVSEFHNDEKFNEYKRAVVNYYLNYDASYIDYEQISSAQGQLCTFSKEGSTAWDISLQEYNYSDGTSFYQAYKKNIDSLMSNVTFDVPAGIIFSDCSGLTEIYTDCLDKKVCKISTSSFTDSIRLVNDYEKNSEDSETVKEGTKLYDGEEYKSLICDLSGKLNALNNPSVINSLPELKVSNHNGSVTNNYKINSLYCDGWKYNSKYKCPLGDCGNIKYTISNQVLEIKDYCNKIFSDYAYEPSNKGLTVRKDECISFFGFYNDLVSKGIIEDQTQGCDFISNELSEKLVWILDLIKIAGPILAIGLGTLDFIKVLASGDSDKEMKNAFKRFSTRLIAAVLLFIIPVILAFLMDVFLGNQSGYDEDNPFCDVVDWE